MIFDKENYVHPLDGINIMDGFWAILDELGLRNNGISKRYKEVSEILPKKKKTLLILIDGMGTNLIKDIIPDSILDKNIKLNMNTVFPSTTATVLTSIATGVFPNEHGINGWYSYHKDKDLPFTPLVGINRATGERISNDEFNEIFVKEPVVNKLDIKYINIMSKVYNESMYSKYSRGYTEGHGFKSTQDAFKIAKDFIKNKEEQLVYLYISEFDTMCHEKGFKSQESKDILLKINNEIEELYKIIDEETRVIVIADHGHIDIKKENYLVIFKTDKLCEYFTSLPGGDERFTSFYIKEGKVDDFVNDFKKRYGEYCDILTSKELDESKLLGHNKMNNMALKSFGDIVAIWKNGYAFGYFENQLECQKVNIGAHSGLTKYEMNVPFIVLSK